MNIRLVKSLALAIAFLMVATALVAIAPVAIAASGSDVTSADGASASANLPGVIEEQIADDNLEESLSMQPDGMTRIYVDTSDIGALDSFLIEHGLKPTNRKPVLGMSTVAITVPFTLVKELGQLPTTKAIIPFVKPIDTGFVDVDEPVQTSLKPSPNDVYTVDEHKATKAWDMGYDGSGVKIAIIDSGIDFGHPDLQGRQARDENGGSPYFGWPLVFDVQSVMTYEDYGTTDGTWYADTSTQVFAMGDFINFDGYQYNVSTIPSFGIAPFGPFYYIGYHPDPNLASFYGEQLAVLVAFNWTSFMWDTVYVDLLNDKTFNNDKPCTRGDEICYVDNYNETSNSWDNSTWRTGDGIADISGGMIYWVSDGLNPLPLANVFYIIPSIPTQGHVVAFAGEFLYGDSHGTGCAASAAGTGRSMDGLLAGMAPGASLICVPTYNSASIIDIWIITVLGYDGTPGTGDEANIASNSYGWDSSARESGLDYLSAVNYFLAVVAPDTIWCWSTGNGGPGYGTANAVTHPVAVMVGAASSMGYRYLMGTGTGNVMYGDVIPFSDHGPTKTGKLDTDIIATGAWGLTPAPLYFFLEEPNGNNSWMTFGGTSMSCPVTAGALALIYEAYDDAYGSFPTNYEAKNLLMCSADDVNHDVLKQGAGFINCERAVKIAADIDGISIAPVMHASSGEMIPNNVWYPGGYRGTNYLSFPDVMFPGDIDNNMITVRNHNLTSATTVTVTDAIFKKSSSSSFNYTTTSGSPFIIDISSYIPVGTELTRITAYCSYDAFFDPGRTYSPIFNYGLELHNWEDLNSDGIPTTSEFSRITVDGSASNMLQATMYNPISRVIDGLILRMQVYWGGAVGIEWNFQVDNYEKEDWTWVNELLGTMNIPAGASQANLITVTLPAIVDIGTYEGALYLTANGLVTVCPILIHVAANTPSFEFGGNLLDEVIFDNNVTAAVDREWRAEVGDWRTFYVDVPDLYPIGPNDKMYVTANWSDVPTDIDVHMLSYVDVSWMANDEPWHMGYVGGSEEYYLGAGTYGFKTSTGGAQEVAGVPFDHGLNQIVLRNPIGAGLKPYEQINGFTMIFDDSVGNWPPFIQMTLNIPSVDPTGTIPIGIYPSGLSGISGVPFGATTFGPVGGFTEMGLITIQDDWTDRYFELTADYDYVKIMTDSAVAGLDIDLYVYWWDGASWVFIGISAGASATETVLIFNPDRGTYLASVYGYSVPGGTQTFDLTVEYPMTGASPFTLSDVPISVDPWGSYQMNLSYDLPNIDGTYNGWVGFGFWGAQDTFRIIIMIVLNDVGAPVIEPISPMDGESINDRTPTFEAYINDTAAYSGVGSVMMIIDDSIGAWPDVTNDIASFTMPWPLEDGMHSLLILAMDVAGNEAEPVLVTFYVDTSTSLVVQMVDSVGVIPNGGLTNESSITVGGFAEVGSNVTVNGISVPVGIMGEFSTTVDLVEGPNSIEVVAIDGVGNGDDAILMVTLDTAVSLAVMPVVSPMSSSTVEVIGMIEVGGQVWVNGVPATVVGGVFNATVTLAEGANVITVLGQDIAGNQAVMTLDVTLDSIAPVVVITTPAAGSNTTVPTIVVNATVADASAVSVRINGVSANLQGGVWNAAITLQEGWNIVTAIAVDVAGNIGEYTISVEYIPPVYVTPDELNDVIDTLNGLIDQLQGELDDLSAALDDLANDVAQSDQDLSDQLDETNQNLDDLNNTMSDNIASVNSTMMIGLIGVLIILLVAIILVFFMLNKKINAMSGSGQAPVTRKVKEMPPPPPDMKP